MSSLDIQAQIIAMLTASYGRPVETPSLPKQDKPSKAKASSKANNVKAPAKSDSIAPKAVEAIAEVTAHHVRPLITSLPLPEKGSLDAKAYIVAMRRAKDRNDRIAAIAGYVGFDVHGEYSSQELAANLQAKRELGHGVKAAVAPFAHGASKSLGGYVHGMPNEQAKRLADLAGREALAAETMLDHEAETRECLAQGRLEGAQYAAAMAKVEGERLTHIQRDLLGLH